MSPTVNDFGVFSIYEKIQEFGLIEIFYLICTSGIWGQSLVLSHPHLLRAHYQEVLQQLTAR